jgi:AmmeMemoRadiSam system protein B/AmmeMemoRadiSam system protein A
MNAFGNSQIDPIKMRKCFRMCAVFLVTAALSLFPLPAVCGAKSVQQPVVAGAFYPSDPGSLKKVVNSYLDAAGKSKVRGEVMALIAPHAGYLYSGPAAGHAYAAVRGLEYDLVVVIAPSHTGSMAGVSVLDMDAYRTPLGDVPIDRRTVRALMDRAEWIKHVPALFTREHSLEVHLPFLQAALKPGFSILPVVMGSPDPRLAAAFADVLAGTLRGRNVLFVASSDMSHFHGYEEAREMDLETLDLIGNGELESLVEQCHARKLEMCGLGPVQLVMRLAQKMGIGGGTVLEYQNSGDTAGDRKRVVGYGSVAFVNPEGSLSFADKHTLLALARTTVEQYVRGKKVPKMVPGSKALAEPGAAFVTLKRGDQLRGCIGQLQAEGPLYRSVIETAVGACSRDTRFPSVRVEELKDIHIEISVMSPFIEVGNIREIEVGRDGLYLESSGRSGVLLPQVPVEAGWDRQEYLKNLCRKAGLPDGAWKKPGAKLYRFETELFEE